MPCASHHRTLRKIGKGCYLANKTLGRDIKCVDIRMSIFAVSMELSIYRKDDTVNGAIPGFFAFPNRASHVTYIPIDMEGPRLHSSPGEAVKPRCTQGPLLNSCSYRTDAESSSLLSYSPSGSPAGCVSVRCCAFLTTSSYSSHRVVAGAGARTTPSWDT